jgi:hypothetical protein
LNDALALKLYCGAAGYGEGLVGCALNRYTWMPLLSTSGLPATHWVGAPVYFTKYAEFCAV